MPGEWRGGAQAGDSHKDLRAGEQQLLKPKRKEQGSGSSGLSGDRQLCPATTQAHLENVPFAVHLHGIVCISFIPFTTTGQGRKASEETETATTALSQLAAGLRIQLGQIRGVWQARACKGECPEFRSSLSHPCSPGLAHESSISYLVS